MNIWFGLGLTIVVGIAAYNTGFKQGLASAPDTVAFESARQESERKHERDLATIAATRAIDAGECLEQVISSDFDLFDYCEQTVGKSWQRDAEEQNRIDEEMRRDLED